MNQLPAGSQPFEKDAQGSTFVHQGELFCRAIVEGSKRILCGRKFSDRGNLVAHVRSYHKDYSIPAGIPGNVRVLAAHYNACMQAAEPQQCVVNALSTHSGTLHIPDVAGCSTDTLSNVQEQEGDVESTEPHEDEAVLIGGEVEEGTSEAEGLGAGEGSHTPEAITEDLVQTALEQQHTENVLATRSSRQVTPSPISIRTRRHPVRIVPIPCPRYKTSNPKVLREKGDPNYKECVRYLKGKGLPTPCAKCTSDGHKGCCFLVLNKSMYFYNRGICYDPTDTDTAHNAPSLRTTNGVARGNSLPQNG
ncbi:hypothetical protein EJ02DRAFT_466582 [Clathrospora elynae]|uniref:C2H2-type domain-containing protein n=1 Tax=Clathrospora elynae TaxID=706981 RepID=A0A6A5SWH7_9PLEO|nr:hypothetical protein EJ02DRAFT_466582 [Clathrospora elynae]